MTSLIFSVDLVYEKLVYSKNNEASTVSREVVHMMNVFNENESGNKKLRSL